MKPLHYIRFWSAIGFALVAGVIFLSVAPSPPEPLDLTYSDKIGHFLAYAMLMFWFAQLYRKEHYPRIAGILVLLGIGLEFVQGLLGYRFFDVADMGANTAGVLLAWALVSSGMGSGLAVLERWFRPA